MPKIMTSYADSKGEVFESLDEATISDIALVLASGAAAESYRPWGRAILIWRKEIEAIFEQYDRLSEATWVKKDRQP